MSGWVVVKQYKREDEYFEKDAYEESDCEDVPNQAGHPASEMEDDNNEESKQGTLPVLSIGNFAG